MLLKLSLTSLPTIRLSENILRQASTVLQEITKRNRVRFEQGTESPTFKNRKEELIRRLQNLQNTRDSFERATSVVGRERLLLSIYLERYGQAEVKKWLPSFDNEVARSVLGSNGAQWHSGRRRQVTQLFFKHYDRLPALPFLCSRLSEAYNSKELSGSEYNRPWYEHSKTIFTAVGHENLAKTVKISENLEKLMIRFCVPEHGRFAEKLRQVFLLTGVKMAQFGKVPPVFHEVEGLRKENAPDNLLMGAASLKIIIGRVVSEGSGNWPSDWSKWIARFGCDPRYGRATVEGAKWWGWATDAELRLAQKGMTGLTLGFFIEYLQKSFVGTEKQAQFNMRARFLQALFKAGKIQDARLVLNRSALQRLDRQYHDPLIVAQLHSTTDQTSMICLRCTDEIYIIEGTHSFGLRMFHREFPIRGFWERQNTTFQDREFRISPDDCPIYLRHDPFHNWVQKFFIELRYKFHKEWDIGQI